MSLLLINQYLSELDRIKRVSGVTSESVVREAFKDLLKAWGKQRDLTFIAEYPFTTATKLNNRVDGALLHELRLPFGYWEAKDEEDDLDAEIAKKFRRGYPQSNIVFEDSKTAVLIQNGAEVLRSPTTDPRALNRLLTLFFSYERPEIADFRKAVVQFKADLPAVLGALREKLDDAYRDNAAFSAAAQAFLETAKQTINPGVGEADVREMLIQHILTEELFAHVFNEGDFHRENNVAKALYQLEGYFFKGDVKRSTLRALEPYYAAIRSAAALIASHSEKQGFLKALYEDFYHVYNEKAADRLGVVYTPSEIVRFMVESADWLCYRHFGKSLVDRNVQVLDPATGTGTFIVELLEHFRGQPEKLVYKYLTELHANEVAILPYYVANLNIEATYSTIMGRYQEFPGLCFVDTLDNVAALGEYSGYQRELFGAISDENIERVRLQNSRRISVIIGNPPYNANQQSENDNNKNREYRNVDRRIKDTYIKHSKAQKTKLYDMYVRFIRWSTDRLDKDGIVCFVSNSSFLHKNSFDGFRKSVAKEFNELWIVDLKGDARSSGDIRRAQGGNIFGDKIKVGVAVYFLVRKRGLKGFRVFYDSIRDYASASEKLTFITHPLASRNMKELQVSDPAHWLGLRESDHDALLPMMSRASKQSARGTQSRTVFKKYGPGISTNRDDWVYAREKSDLEAKMASFIAEYNTVQAGTHSYPDSIKWSRNLKRRLSQGKREPFDRSRIVRASYRPFETRWLYLSSVFTDELGLAGEFFPPGAQNIAISISAPGSRTGFVALAVKGVADLHFGAAVDGYQQVPRHRYVNGHRIDNITDWALKKFREKYPSVFEITKDDIFAYVYAVLHDPAYREKYQHNLKRDFPGIPFYQEFPRWTAWGKQLLALHAEYENVEPWPLERVDTPNPELDGTGQTPAVKLKSDHTTGTIRLDEITELRGIPRSAWLYILGNRCALDWVLDLHKERKPRDPAVRERFHSYRFAEHKERVVQHLQRLTRVSVETMSIVELMRELPAEVRLVDDMENAG